MNMYWLGVICSFIIIYFIFEVMQHGFMDINFRPWMWIFFIFSFGSWITVTVIIGLIIVWFVCTVIWWVIRSMFLNGGLL